MKHTVLMYLFWCILMITIRYRPKNLPYTFSHQSPGSLLHHVLIAITIHQFFRLLDFLRIESDSRYRVTELWHQSLWLHFLLKQEFWGAIELSVRTGKYLTTAAVKGLKLLFPFCSIFLAGNFWPSGYHFQDGGKWPSKASASIPLNSTN